MILLSFMNEKNQKMLNLLSSILGVDVDKLLDRMIYRYIDNLPNKELQELEDALEDLEQEEISS